MHYLHRQRFNSWFSHGRRPQLLQVIRILSILAVPDISYYIIVFILIIFHGGHHFSLLRKNPFCSRVYSTSDCSNSPLSNMSGPPQLLIHISDLHVNDVSYGKSKSHLLSLQNEVLPRWGPLAAAIVVSGDLVHGVYRQSYPLGSRSMQRSEEWQWLDEYAARVNRTLPWLATYGNHDTFGGFPSDHPDISNISALICPALRSSASRPRLRHYHFDTNSLHLLLIDGTPSKPFHRPFNFFGNANLASNQLRSALDDLNAHFRQDSSLPRPNVLVVGHYPSSTMASGNLIHTLANSGDVSKEPRFAAYLSGHLHDIYGVAKHGLTVTSKYGSLELESTDMSISGTYRLLTFDGSVLSYRSFSVRDDVSYNFLQQAMILNLPQAGLCSAGAGVAGFESTHIRVLSPSADLRAHQTVVEIDGHPIGILESLNHVCSDDSLQLDGRGLAICQHVYGVKWNSSHYAKGVHYITLRANDTTSDPFSFSLDGSPPESLHSRAYTLMSAIFSLSNFDSISIQLSIISLLLSVACVLPGTRRRESLPIIIFTFGILFLCGFPVIVAKNLTDGDAGYGVVGLYYSYLSAVIFPSHTDIPFILVRQVLWMSLLQISYIQAVRYSGLLCQASHWTVILALVSLRRCWSWCMEIAGAYGLSSALLSPSCAPLLCLSFWSVAHSISTRRAS